MTKKEMITRLQQMLDSNEPTFEAHKETIKAVKSEIQKDRWLDAARLLELIFDIADKFFPH